MNLSAARAWVVGASSGIGAALAGELDARGARVAISARRADRLAEVAERADRRLYTRPLDITHRTEVAKAADDVVATLGGLDVLVVSAGMSIPIDARRFDAGAVATVMDVNVLGTANVIEAVLPRLLAQGSGTLAAIASIAGYRGIPGLEAYGASKAAQISMLESLRASVRGSGVNVCTICPGFVESDLSARVRRRPFLLGAAEAASTIADGLEGDRLEIAFPLPVALAGKVGRLLPVRLWTAALGRFGRRFVER